MRIHSRTLVFVALILLACRVVVADARNVTYDLHIPAQSLNGALQALAIATNCKLLYASELVDGKNAPSVKGEYTIEQAVQILLTGSDLAYEVSDGLVLIQSKRANAYSNYKALDIRVSQAATLTAEEAAPGAGISQEDQGKDASATSQDSEGGIKLEEIVITAERRSEDIQKAALSVSERDGDELKNEGKYNLSTILEDIPGIEGGAALNTGTSLSSGTDSIAAGVTIRGIQSNTGAALSGTSTPSAAAVYVDGVYSGVGGDYDIQRVEALRGPQGTLYGRSATSGVIAIHTQNPDLGMFNGNAQVEIGDYALQHYSAAINLPVTDDILALRVSGNEYKRDGFYSPNGGAYENSEARAKLFYKPTDDLSILFGVAFDDNKTYTGGTDALIQLTSPDSYTFSNNPLGSGTNQYRQYWAEVNWDLGPVTLTYLPAVRTWKSQLDLAIRSVIQNTNESEATPSDNFITNELRIASNPGSVVAWQAGTLIYKNDLDNSSNLYYYPSGAVSDLTSTQRTTRSVGLFSEATYPIATSWRVTGGLRYDYTKVATNQQYTSNTNELGDPLSSTFGLPETLVVETLSGADATRLFRNWTYKARVEHDLAPTNLLYGLVSSGFLPGDLSVARNLALQPITVDMKSQTLRSYEFGTKNRFFDNALQINFDLFYESYSGYETAGINISPNPFVVSTALLTAGVQSWGEEFELLYQMTAHDRVGLNIGYTNARYVDKSEPVPGTTNTFGTYFGKDAVPGVVPLTTVLSYDHTVALPLSSTLALHGDVRALSPHAEGRIDAADLQAGRLLSYVDTPTEVIGDVSANWSFAHGYSLTGYVRNVGDNRYKTGVSILAPVLVLATPYDPRTYGFIVAVKW